MRELEERARGANAGGEGTPRVRRSRHRLHPDQEAAVAEIADRFGSASGRDVEVTATAGGGYRVHLTFDSALDALEFSDRLRA